MKNVEKLLENIYLIDDHDLSMSERTGTYVLAERDLTIIETSASPSVPYIIQGLKELGYSPKDIKYIIVTHIHLDHSGGAGLLLQECPEATVVVHPKGKRHLADPSRLIAGARVVYGEKFDTLFDPILPIPENNILVMNDRDTLSISDDLTLTFYDTPGHSNHHFSIHHSRVNGMFTGDTTGISYKSLLRDGVEVYLPSTSPNQFDPHKMQGSIDLYKSLNLDFIFFGHYGMSSNPNEVYKQVSFWIQEFVRIAEYYVEQTETMEKQVESTTNGLLKAIQASLRERQVPDDHIVYKIIQMDMEVSAMGLVEYVLKQQKIEK